MTDPDTPDESGPEVIQLRATTDHNMAAFVSHEGFLAALYRGDFTHCVRAKMLYSRATAYTIDELLAHLPECQVVRAVEGQRHQIDFLVKGKGWWGSLGIRDTAVYADFGCGSLEQGHELMGKFRDGVEARDLHKHSVGFSVMTGPDDDSSRRFSEVPWDTISENYTSATRQTLSELMALDRNQATGSGKILVFHGPPGTGKTWAIRSLLTAWREWAAGVVVLDPGVMLTSNEYSLEAISDISEGMLRLLILEDVDEIIEKKSAHSAGLSRLLNLTDGLVGASSNTLVLLSANASLGKLDPALLRPGRCLAIVAFDAFSPAEASQRIGRTVNTPHTLAEIFEASGSLLKLSNETAASIGQYL
jgi:hypothetical protein